LVIEVEVSWVVIDFGSGAVGLWLVAGNEDARLMCRDLIEKEGSREVALG
jgi:hypothetical protein